MITRSHSLSVNECLHFGHGNSFSRGDETYCDLFQIHRHWYGINGEKREDKKYLNAARRSLKRCRLAGSVNSNSSAVAFSVTIRTKSYAEVNRSG